MNSDPNFEVDRSPSGDPSPAPVPEATTGSEDTRWLRDAFAESAHQVTPPPFSWPLIQGRRRRQVRRRRLVVTLTAACVGLLVPLTVPWDGLRSPAPEPNPPAASVTVPDPDAAPGPEAVRAVRPGERVAAGPGVEFWLTEEGKHWSTPELPEQFRSVVDGNLDRSEPGVSLQTEALGGSNVLMSGLYYGTEDAAGVTVSTDAGTVEAQLLHLADAPDWGVWYVAPPALANDGDLTVTVHDADGNVLATLSTPPFPEP